MNALLQDESARARGSTGGSVRSACFRRRTFDGVADGPLDHDQHRHRLDDMKPNEARCSVLRSAARGGSVSLTRLILAGVLGVLLVAQLRRTNAEVIFLPMAGLDLARQKATQINCYNNLKLIVSAARGWSFDRFGQAPATFQDFMDASTSPVILFCSADASRQATTNWDGFDWTQINYEWIPQTTLDWPFSMDVCCRCRVHNIEATPDGYYHDLGGYHSGWPEIIAAPMTPYATPGSDIQFQVRVAPDVLSPVHFQWRRESLSYATNVTFYSDPELPEGGWWRTNRFTVFTPTVLDQETNSTLWLRNISTNADGFYSVALSNAMGTVASVPVRLTVRANLQSPGGNLSWPETICLNNLKQICLLGRIWADDHGDQMPTNFASMTNRFGLPNFGWPVALYCPSDTARPVPAEWPGVDLTNTSYELLPGNLDNPYDIFCRCKLHGFYVQMGGQAVSQPRFLGLRSVTNNAVELSFQVFAGRTNLLEASADLTNWTSVAAYAPTNGEFLFSETNSADRRFYRIRLP